MTQEGYAAQDQAAALEIAEAKAKEIARVQKGGYSGPTSSSGAPNANTELLSTPINSGLKPNLDPNYYNVGGEQNKLTPNNLVTNQNNGLDDLAKWSNQVSGAMGDGVKNGASMESKLSNQDVVTELQKMNANLTAIASRPSELNVTTANPVSDAADIYSNISKNAVRSANV